MNAISVKKLTKYYGKSRGIIDVDLDVPRGDFFGFIGPNGAGKSTLIRTLLGLISKTGGEGTVLGQELGATELLSKVGYLPSELNFYRGMKASEIIDLSAKLRNTDCTAEAAKLVKRLELDVSKRIEELSLGNKKKLGIVCALQHKPELYILDEPTSGLDPLMQREFYSILKERNDEGATVFLSSHVLSEVAKYCRHAAVISEGRILACDSIDKLGHSGIKKITLHGVDKSTVSTLSGIRDIKEENGNISFICQGEAKTLVNELSSLDFDDVSITDPDLEEIFMHYYKKEGN